MCIKTINWEKHAAMTIKIRQELQVLWKVSNFIHEMHSLSTLSSYQLVPFLCRNTHYPVLLILVHYNNSRFIMPIYPQTKQCYLFSTSHFLKIYVELIGPFYTCVLKIPTKRLLFCISSYVEYPRKAQCLNCLKLCNNH